MDVAKVTFRKIIQDVQDHESIDPNQNHMVSKIEFAVEIDGTKYNNCYVQVRQPFGTDYSTEPLEVGPPNGYRGRWNHQAFSEQCESYYRQIFITSGSVISLQGVQGVRMRNNTVIVPKTVEFAI